MKQLPKACNVCGRVYFSLEEWRALAHVSTWDVEPGMHLELRDCGPPCINTLSIFVEDTHGPEQEP